MIPLYVDLSQRKKGDRIPYSIANLSNEENLCLPQDFVVGFAEKDNNRGEVFEIEYDEEEIEINVADCRNWIPQKKETLTTSRPCREGPEKPEIINSEIDLHQLLASSTNFIKSPAEVNSHRKVDLQDQSIKQDTRDKFNNLCKEYNDIIFKGSGDIGKTLLIEMDIDTGDSPPIACTDPNMVRTAVDYTRGSDKVHSRVSSQ